MKNMINFTVGPVQSNEEIREIGAEQVPYFRTPEFSEIMLENERLMKKFADAEENARTVFITGSGTASMEATIMNTLNENDKVLIVNGGGFGKRFVELCKIHDIPYDEISLQFGESLTNEHLNKFNGASYTGFIVNVHETSTGVHYDMDIISEYCKKNNLFLIVDAISSFLADEFSMKKYNADVMITGSQKALACPPGISIIVLSEKAIQRVENNNCKCMYFDLKDALKNGERGQTPFTPAVGILRQINVRLKGIENNGGANYEVEKVKNLANDFRNKIKDLPFEFVTSSPSNAVTSLHPVEKSAYDIFTILKDEYNIWICPNGGDLRDKVFRVGHIGALTIEDNNVLINAFNDMQKRGLL